MPCWRIYNLTVKFLNYSHLEGVMLRIRIVKPKKRDKRGVFKLLKQLFPHKEVKKEEIEKILPKDDSEHLLIAKRGRKILGYVSLTILFFGFIAYVRHLVVAEGFRGMGIGRQLLGSVIGIARNRSCKAVTLTAFRRKKAHKFYKSNQFKKITCFFFRKV